MIFFSHEIDTDSANKKNWASTVDIDKTINGNLIRKEIYIFY